MAPTRLGSPDTANEPAFGSTIKNLRLHPANWRLMRLRRLRVARATSSSASRRFISYASDKSSTCDCNVNTCVRCAIWEEGIRWRLWRLGWMLIRRLVRSNCAKFRYGWDFNLGCCACHPESCLLLWFLRSGRCDYVIFFWCESSYGVVWCVESGKKWDG